MNAINDKFSESFSNIVGIDTSPDMTEVAKSIYSDKSFVFERRENFSNTQKRDLIVEVGVINYADFQNELDFAHNLLKDGGIYAISLAGDDSFWNRMKKGDKGFKNFLSYGDYEKEINKRFNIIESAPVGLFIPLIWKLPFLARIIQPIEAILRPLAPNSFHEKVYILKKK